MASLTLKQTLAVIKLVTKYIQVCGGYVKKSLLNPLGYEGDQ